MQYAARLNGNNNSTGSDGALQGSPWSHAISPTALPHMHQINHQQYAAQTVAAMANGSPPPQPFGIANGLPVIHAVSQSPQQPIYIVFDSNGSSQSTGSLYPSQNSSLGYTVVKMDQPGQTQTQLNTQVQHYQQQQQQQLLTLSHLFAQQQQQQAHRPQQTQTQAQQRPVNDVRQWGFAVVDQLHPLLTRVPLPPSAVEDTRGIGLYNTNVVASSTRPCISQVCLLHAYTGCQAGRDCASFHVSPDYLLLSRAVSQPLCCALHNCFYSHEMIRSDCVPGVLHRAYCIALDTPQMLAAAGAGSSPRHVDISLLHLSMTVGLETLPVRRGMAVISLRRQVCRLHLEGRCKWTKDCGHVHVCRSFFPMLKRREALDFLDAVPREDPNDLARRIAEAPDVVRFLQSAAVLPMVAELLRRKRADVLMALLTGKVACAPQQLEAMIRMGAATGAWDVTLTEVSPKIIPCLVP